MSEHHEHDDFGGLHRDLRATGAVIDRRGLLRLAATFGGAVGALQLIGCSSDTPTSPTTTPTPTTTATSTPPTATTPTTGATCSRIPEETAGPFPANGSNGPSVLNQTGVVRRDIRTSFAGLSATSVANKSATSQIALPKATNDLVYAVAGYEDSVRHAAQVTLASDSVFRDGSSLELATITGTVAAGFTATLTVAV